VVKTLERTKDDAEAPVANKTEVNNNRKQIRHMWLSGRTTVVLNSNATATIGTTI